MKKLTHKQLKKKCDKLWALCVKARAKNRSELSNKEGRLHAHHVMKKPNLFLRYNLDNGFCLTNGEHFAVHNLGREWELHCAFIAQRGEALLEALDRFRLLNVKNMPEWTLEGKYEDLKEELKKYD